MTKSVAVLMGGWSVEREVSLTSGQACADALTQAGYQVKTIDVHKDFKKLIEDLGTLPDVVFNALHGSGGEDGVVQGLLDTLNVPYTHSGQLASALAMNKQKSKDFLQQYDIPVPQGVFLKQQDLKPENIPFSPPLVIKPNAEGSSVGIYIIRQGDNRLDEICARWHHGDALVEKYIPGRELTVTVMENQKGDCKALAITEIRAKLGQFYDYDSKYENGGSEHIIPAVLPEHIAQDAQKFAIIAHQKLGCSGVTRTDFRYDDRQEKGLYFLETNTQPGMTPTSLVPEQASYCGISFEDLVTWMVENASCHA